MDNCCGVESVSISDKVMHFSLLMFIICSSVMGGIGIDDERQ